MKKKESIIIDLLIVLAYIAIVIFGFLCIRFKLEFMLQWGFPIILITVVTAVFVNYIVIVVGRAKKNMSDGPGGKEKQA